ncbi:hypothetical protein [Shewanella youngdeokensis]|uniref:Lipoprotein n=1 Tax=Shewanella youngdeokensis TaxID=2999068 RepID=A0ABZ0JY02_9GAMM|nr:hypothetical protein RGE70_18225 [Shewanella sp. DAU334]
MKLLSSLFAAAITLTLSGCIINVNADHGGPMEHQKKQLQLNAADIDTFTANTGAGELIILGVDGLSEINVTADIYTYGDNEANLVLKKQGRKAKLIAEFDSNIHFNRSPYIDLTIKVPATMMLALEDGSGDIEINGVTANINLDDGSGSLLIKGGQDLNIVDGSGSISISNTTGKLNLDDGSGSINLNNIGGSTNINDGSGSIIVNNIGDNTNINDGSGDITVTNVNGHVVIDDGSGDIEVDNTKGLSIVEAGSGDLSIDNINGSVSMH